MTGSLGSLRELNRLRIVDALRHDGPASRADIARQTGLSASTVSSVIGELQSAGFVVESELAPDGRQGRPAAQLTLDPSAGAAVGLDFDHDKVRVAVSDLARSVLAEASVRLDVDQDATAAIEHASDLVGQVLDEAGVGPGQVLGAGMALPGPVDHARGALHQSPILSGWTGVDAASELQRRIGIPVHLDNDANLGALAEVTLGAGRNARSAAYIQMSSGIGAGLIVDGRPYHGHRGTAGEIGHVLVDEQGLICRCGNRGCLETLASGPALLALLRSSHGDLTVERLIEIAREGDPGARRVIADAGRAVGRAVAGLCNLFNPEMVVVGGDLSAAGELLLDPLRESIERYALPAATENLDVVAGELGERANLLGALALAIAQSGEAVAARIAGTVSAA
ncbi:MAG: ROK family transcriptional regulator [Thermoleophilaceae bacterium]|nr:ROK family transcriptional regulator [Thermoleophilaceae bacterium]